MKKIVKISNTNRKKLFVLHFNQKIYKKIKIPKLRSLMKNSSVKATIDELCFEVKFDRPPTPTQIDGLFEPGGKLFFDLNKNGFLDSEGTVSVPFCVDGGDKIIQTPDGKYLVTIKCTTKEYAAVH